MTLSVEVTDLETGETDTATVVDGDYLILAHAPCYVHGIQTYGNGTVMITVKAHMLPRVRRPVPEPVPVSEFDEPHKWDA